MSRRCPIGGVAAVGAACVGWLAGCASVAEAPGAERPAPNEAGELASWMTGSFSSAAQAEEDAAYFAVTLEMAPIWGDRSDGPWLYVEQALASSPERPYRQRVYRLVQEAAGVVRSDVFTLPGDALSFAGAHSDRSLLVGLTPDDLTLRSGCSITLTRAGASRYLGSTAGTACRSTLNGAAYATSEVEITPAGLISWDRGFDAGHEQVWGSTAGGYVFDKLGAATP